VSSGGDPHRVLGVPRDASEAEIKRAYRALAKRHHPDAGQGSVVRFLEIQAAYETLVGVDRPGAPSRAGTPSRPGARSGPAAPRPAPPRPAARPAADPRPGTEWARRPPPAASRPGEPSPRPGGSPAGRRPFGEPGPGRAGHPGDAAGRSGTGDPARGGRARGRRRATLGSTSYDGAEETFEPGWGGASWYGPSSGTYWKLNPREYADPRKHGPEYQARARRRAAAPPPDGAGDAGPGEGRPLSEDAAAPPSSGDAASAPPRAGEWAPAAGERAAPRPAPPRERAAAPNPAASAGRTAPAAPSPAASAGPGVVAGPGVAARTVLAILAWLVPGLALAAAAGLPGGLAATLPLQAAGVALLAFAPRAAWAALGGAVVLVFATIPIVAVVAALGGRFVPGGPAPEAAVVLAALAWIAGLGVVAAGRVAPYPWAAPS